MIIASLILHECYEFPNDMVLHFKHIQHPGDAWLEESLGPWPQNGAIAVYGRIPSANRSIHTPQSFKHTMILIAEERQQHLNLNSDMIFTFFKQLKQTVSLLFKKREGENKIVTSGAIAWLYANTMLNVSTIY